MKDRVVYLRGCMLSAASARLARQSAGPVFHQPRGEPALGETAPTVRQMRQRRQGGQLLAIERLDVQQAPGSGQRPLRRGPIDQLEHVARANGPCFDDAVIPTRPPALLYAQRHVLDLEAKIEFPARLASLRDLQQRAPEAKNVAERDALLVHACGREILAECARPLEKRNMPEFATPAEVVLEGVMVDRLVGSAVAACISLCVLFESVAAEAQRGVDRLLVDGAGDPARAERADRADQQAVQTHPQVTSPSGISCRW